MSRIALKIEVGNRLLPALLLEQHSCFGKNINPFFRIENIPPEGKSLALIMESSSKEETPLTHWVAWNIPATGLIFENEQRGETGKNDFGIQGYWGPSLANSTKKYTFRFFVLDRFLSFSDPSGVSKFELYPHIIDFGLGHGKLEFQNYSIKIPNYCPLPRLESLETK